MRICVVGVGAIGGFLGARLGAAGFETSALARGATLAALREHGWRAETADGLLTAPVRASADPADLGEQDLVILTVKAQSLPEVSAKLPTLIGPGTTVLSALNGVPWWFFGDGRRLESVDPGGRIAAAVPIQHVLGGVAHMSSSVSAPGVARHNRGTELIIGEPDNSDSARAHEIVDLLRVAGLDANVSTAIRKDIWYKLWGNLTMNPVSALTRATADRILDDDLVRAFCESAMLEAQEIGARIGCPIDETPEDRNKVTRQLGAFKTSMLQDAEAGRALELDALVGAVREIGIAVGVPTPFIDALLGLTRLSARA